MRQISQLITCCLVAFVFLVAAGCGPNSPEDQVAATRAQYTVRLESFTAEQPEPEPVMEEEVVAEEGEAAATATASAVESAMVAEEAVAGEEGAGEEGMDEEEVVESGPRPTDVILHLLVRFGGDEALPGITVEVTQADPFGKEKEPTLHWVETAGMGKSDVQQVDLRLEGIEYEDGDGFSVLLRQTVPAEDRAQYREFAEAGS